MQHYANYIALNRYTRYIFQQQHNYIMQEGNKLWRLSNMTNIF